MHLFCNNVFTDVDFSSNPVLKLHFMTFLPSNIHKENHPWCLDNNYAENASDGFSEIPEKTTLLKKFSMQFYFIS